MQHLRRVDIQFGVLRTSTSYPPPFFFPRSSRRWASAIKKTEHTGEAEPSQFVSWFLEKYHQNLRLPEASQDRDFIKKKAKTRQRFATTIHQDTAEKNNNHRSGQVKVVIATTTIQTIVPPEWVGTYSCIPIIGPLAADSGVRWCLAAFPSQRCKWGQNL